MLKDGKRENIPIDHSNSSSRLQRFSGSKHLHDFSRLLQSLASHLSHLESTVAVPLFSKLLSSPIFLSAVIFASLIQTDRHKFSKGRVNECSEMWCRDSNTVFGCCRDPKLRLTSFCCRTSRKLTLGNGVIGS